MKTGPKIMGPSSIPVPQIRGHKQINLYTYRFAVGSNPMTQTREQDMLDNTRAGANALHAPFREPPKNNRSEAVSPEWSGSKKT